MANDVEELRSALDGAATDPCRRFMYVATKQFPASLSGIKEEEIKSV